MTVKDIGNGGIKAAFERLHHGTHGYYGGGSGGGGGGGYNYHHQAPTYHGSPHVIKHYSYSHSEGGGKGGGNKGGAALSALTLLSFLFFLNILQQCLKDQMAAMNPQVMVMTSGREDIGTSAKSVENKEDESTSLTPPEYVLGEGVGRAYPAVTMAEKLPADEKDNTENEDHTADIHTTQFVDAMGDGIGEVISEQK